MYWFSTNNLLDFILYLLLSCGWAVGGLLLVRYAFRLGRNEHIVTGLAGGFLLFISLSNLLAHILPLTPAFWAASILILAAGLLVAWRSNKQAGFNTSDLRSIPLLVGLAAITILFTLILRGESIFDEYLHLPLISIMAAGDIPPHFTLNPALIFAYHYAIQVFAASMVRLANFFPWSAWDASRALAIGFTLILGWIWVRKVTASKLAAWLGSFLFTFAGGARWLLLLLPSSWLNRVSQSVNLINSGLDTAPTLAQALHSSWVIEGGGPVPFPFAFHNGIFVPVFFILGSTGALPFMTIFLLLILLPRGLFSNSGLIIWSLLFATLALSAEHIFAVVWVGILIAIGLALLFRKQLHITFFKPLAAQWGLILVLTGILALVQGGFITETVRTMINAITGAAAQSYNAGSFSLRLPPGLLSSHLGQLSLFNSGQVVALLAELGPALLILPVGFLRFTRDLKQGNLFLVGLAVSVVFCMLFPLFFEYQIDRQINRITAAGLWIALVLGFPVLWLALPRIHTLGRIGLALGFLVTVLGGVVIFRIQLYSIRTPQYAYFINGLDARNTAEYWNKLPPGTQVLDRVPERSVTIFGRKTRAYSSMYDPLPDWQALIADPNPSRIAAAGYDYVYMDRIWWEGLTQTQREYYQEACIDIVDQREQENKKDFRMLIDVSACKP